MPKVLIISSDRSSIKLYETAITFQGIEAILAHSAEEALGMLNQKPSLILLDILTPDLKDINLIKEIQEKDRVPVIIVADIKRNHALSESSIEGACEYLSKSETSVGEIIKKVRKAIDEEKAAKK